MPYRALLLTDLVNSTRMVEARGDAWAAQAWAAHDRLARDLLARLGGRELSRTDGFFLMFGDPVDAARFALAYHHELAQLGLAARVGLHAGPVVLRDNSPDDIRFGAVATEVDGLATPLTARIMTLARGGQTLVTAAAALALRDPLREEVRLKCHGFYRLKGIEAPMEIFELAAADASHLTPPADVEKAYRVIRIGDLWQPARAVRHNLSAERDLFVGRAAELGALATHLDAGTRLLTVIGPGGIGKTRMARRFGWTWLGDWPGGVYFCDLSETRSLDGILFAVASALEIALGRDDPLAQIGHAIAGRGRCLVIFDNFEQVVTHAQATLGRWLDRAADASFLVTSREALHLRGEQVITLGPLPLDAEAIELFACRARGSVRISHWLGRTGRRSPRWCAWSTGCRWASNLPRHASGFFPRDN